MSKEMTKVLDTQAVINFILQVLPAARVGNLEKKIIKYSYEKKTYQQLIDDHDYNENYTLRAANSLWKDLSKKLQEPINKGNFHQVINKKLESQQPQLIQVVQATPEPELELVTRMLIPGKAMGKARPRKSSRTNRMHMPANYVRWQSSAVKAIKMQIEDMPPAPMPAVIRCSFVNFLSSDTDNLVGSVLDALVKAGYLQNDSSSFVIESSGKFVKTKKRRGVPREKGVIIEVYKGYTTELEADIFDEFKRKFPKLIQQFPT